MEITLLDTLDRCCACHIVHVGGGDGSLLSEVLWHLPRATGVLCDGAAAIAAAPRVLAAAGVDDRVDVAPLDATDAIPPGGDVYLLSLPAVPGDDLSALLRRCRSAMASAAHLVVLSPALDGRSTARRRDLVDRLATAGFDVAPSDATDPPGRVLLAHPHPD